MPKNNEVVSIIVPIYNNAKYMTECVDSLLNQTYHTLEIILVDDGSSDESSRICDYYGTIDNRIKVIHKENGGASSAREAGLDNATGEFIVFVDGDDWLEPETVAQCMEAAKSYDGIDCVLFSYVKEFLDSSVPMHIMDHDRLFSKAEAEMSVYRRLFGLYDKELSHPERMDNIVSCCMKLYRYDLARNGKFYDHRIIGSSEDALFNMYALYGCRKVIYIDKGFYHYRKSGTSITSSYRPNLDKKWCHLFKEMENVIEEKKLSEIYRESLSNRIALSITGIGMNALCNDNAKLWGKYKEIRGYLRSEYYQNACKKISIKYMPMKWKIFFVCCKLKLSLSVFIMMLLITKLRMH